MKTDQKLTAMDILDSFYVKSEKNEIDELRLMEYFDEHLQEAETKVRLRGKGAKVILTISIDPDKENPGMVTIGADVASKLPKRKHKMPVYQDPKGGLYREGPLFRQNENVVGIGKAKQG